MKNYSKFKQPHDVATIIIVTLWLLATCRAPRAAAQDSNGWNLGQAPTAAGSDLYRFDGSSQTGPSVSASQAFNTLHGFTSLGTYNRQNQTLTMPWRPPANPDTAALSPEPLSANTSRAIPPEGSATVNALGNIGAAVPATSRPSDLPKVILPNGSVISVPAEMWPGVKQLTGDAGSPTASSATGWRSYVCRGASKAGGGVGVAAALKGLGVENEALETLTDALSSHSALVAIAVVGGYAFYSYNCP